MRWKREVRDAFRAQGRLVDATACAAATLRLIGQGINDVVNPAASFRVRKVLTDLHDIAAVLDGKTPEDVAKPFARFADVLSAEVAREDVDALFADVDAWVLAAARFCVERDPQLDIQGALPKPAAPQPIAIVRRDRVAEAAD